MGKVRQILSDSLVNSCQIGNKQEKFFHFFYIWAGISSVYVSV